MLVRVMGLTIHYRIKLKAVEASAGIVDAKRLVQQARSFAMRLLRQGRVKHVGDIGESREILDSAPAWDRRLDYEGQWRLKHVLPTEGWLFNVDVGDGCETVQMGLCRYPYTGPYVGSRKWAKLHSPQQAIWRLESFCKTQYASRHGWHHFLACHRTVLDLVNYWRRAEAKVFIWDEGGFWPRCLERRLRRNIAEYDQCLAAFGGALKDAAGERGETIEAPILNHPHFEQLEAVGLSNHGQKIAQAVTAVKHLLP